MEDGRAERTESQLDLQFSGKTIPSVNHPNRNEDAIGLPAFDEEKNLNWAAVLDGVGGSFGGGRASRVALEVISEELSNFTPKSVSEAVLKVTGVIQKASEEIFRTFPGSETTVVLVKFVDTREGKIAVFGSVGDSRAYLFRDGKLEQVTEDDSVIPVHLRQKFDEIVDDNDLSDDDYNVFMRRNIVTQVLGSPDKLDVHVYQKVLKRGDKILLTSDGVHDNLTTGEICQQVVESGDVARKLVDKAYTRSQTNYFRAKKDDISVVVVEVK